MLELFSSRVSVDQDLSVIVAETINDDDVKGVGSVQSALTFFCGGVAQAFHDDRVVNLKEQLVVEEVDGEGQEGKVMEEGRGRIKENAPWI